MIQEAKMPPYSQEAEQGILGSILLDNDGLALATGIESSFYRAGHRTIYSAMLDLSSRGEPIDILTLIEELKIGDRLEQAGGAAYIAGLPDGVPSTAHIESYVRIVSERSTLRDIIAVCNDIALRANNPDDVDGFINKVGAEFFDVAVNGKKTEAVSMRDLMLETSYRLEKKIKPGISTSYRRLDDILAGLHGGDLVIIAARPGMGKTTFSLNLAMGMAIANQTPSAYFSLEMNKGSLALKMICAKAHIDSQAVRKGELTKKENGLLFNACLELQTLPLWIDETPALNIIDFRVKLRNLVAKYGVKCAFVDYLQLMKAPRFGGNREQEIADISGGLKAAAKEFNISVVAMSQLNRKVEESADQRPKLSNLRESGAIEQDADVVMFLYRNLKKPELDDLRDPNEMECIIAKQRSGPTDTVKFIFDEPTGRFK